MPRTSSVSTIEIDLKLNLPTAPAQTKALGSPTDAKHLETQDAFDIGTRQRPLRSNEQGSNALQAAFLAQRPRMSNEALLHRAFPRALRIQHTVLQGGFSGSAVIKVDVDGKYFVLKRSCVGCSADAAEAMRKEIGLAKWAANIGVGPRVIDAEVALGYWICDFVQAEHTGWADAFAEPRFSATLRAAKKVHVGAQDATPSYTNGAPDVAGAAKLMARMTPMDVQHPQVIKALKTIDTANRMLREMPFHEVTCHGDLSPGNTLYTPAQLFLIDWEQSHRGDAMAELASMAEQFNLTGARVVEMMGVYGGTSEADLRRFDLYVVMRIARRVLESFVGMPWNDEADKPAIIAAACARLQAAAESVIEQEQHV